MRSIRSPLLIVVVAALTGCSWLSDDKGWIVDRSDDYLKAKEGPPLIIPEDMASAPIQDIMPIAPVESSRRHGDLTGEAPLPEAIYAREETASVKIQKLGDARWLLIPQPPAVVWPKVKQFFADNGVPIAFEKPEAGRIDSQWLTIDKGDARDVVRLTILAGKDAAAISTGRDRVRVLVEQGIRDRSSEIHLRYENDSKSIPVEDTMPGQSDVLEVESQLLNEMGAYVAADVADATISYVARNISTQNKAAIESDEQNLPVLRLNLDFERAWATVSQALGDANLPVSDVDRTDRVMYITVSDEVLNQEGKPGVFTRWLHRDKTQAIQVRLVPVASGYQVTLFDAAGQRVPAELAEKILIMIREFAA
jgi:outer membrane protein assembly factor BamC